jgi:signal transduction histidine kinase
LDYALILALIPAAALLYNRSDDLLLAANQPFEALTGYRSTELQGVSLSKLLSKKLDTNPTGSENRKVLLKVASGDSLPVNLNIKSLSQTNQIVALNFNTEPPTAALQQENTLRDFFSQLTAIIQQDSTSKALIQAAEVLRDQIHPQAIAAYVYESKKKQLLRMDLDFHLTGSQFPQELSLKDLADPINISMWQAGQPPLTSLQEIALVQGSLYLLTLPLLYNQTLQGCLIASGNGSLAEEISAELEFLAKLTASTLHQLTWVENAQRTLQNARQLVQIEHALVDNLEEGIILLTPELLIAEMSPAAESMLGYATGEAFRQQAELVLIGNQSLTAILTSAQQGISTQIGQDFHLSTRTGRSFQAEIQCVPVLSDAKVVSIILILRDRSQSEQIRVKNQELEQRAWLGELSAVFAHEVKNPINSIMTGLQYMGMTMKPGDPHQELISRLQNDCMRLTHLMDSTLVFSKPVDYHLVPVDLSLMIPQLLEKVAPRMTNLKIKYNFDAHPQNPMVKADYRALERVFENLINNAIQAMEKSGGTLNIKVTEADKHLIPAQYDVIVADSGPGIPDDLREHIFEPFVTTKSTGTGLGLAISKRIMTAHKGNLYVESFPGGTMFHVLLPKAD